MTQNFNLGLLGQHINVTSTSVTLISNTNFSANIALANNVTLLANGSVGTAGQTLTSNGTGLYWSTGPNGYTGSAGSSGGTGFTGSTGTQGNQGYTGSVGTQGDIGYTGSTGSQGNQGYTGSIGSSGTSGYSGSTGSIGYTGSIGAQGNLGYTGSAGYNGSVGYVGSIGSQGIQGYTGSAGEFAGGYVGSVSTTSLSTSSVTSNTGVIDLLTSQNVTVVQGISVGNTTVNTSITAAQIFSGNTTANAIVTSNYISVTNSASNTYMTSSVVFSGNSTANAFIDMTGGTITVPISKFNVDAAGKVTIYTTTPHNITMISNPFGSIKGAERSWINRDRFSLAGAPAANIITFTVTPQTLGNTLKITRVQRTGNSTGYLATYYTGANHGLQPGDIVNVTGGTASGLTNFADYNLVSNTIFSVPAANSFTIFSNSKINFSYTVSNSFISIAGSVSSAVLGKSYTDKVYITLRTTSGRLPPSQALLPITISGVTGFFGSNTSGWTLGGVKPTLNGTYILYDTTAGSNAFNFALFTKISNAPGIVASTNTLINANSTITVSSNNDIPLYDVPMAMYVSVPRVANTTSNTGFLNIETPVSIYVGNTYAATKITPTSIFIGNTVSNNVFIDASKITYNKRGSYLQTIVDGSGFTVTSLLDENGQVDPETDIYFANSSIVTIGDNLNYSTITKTEIATSQINVGSSSSQILINSDGISINDVTSAANTIITSSSADFSGGVSVGTILTVNAISSNGTTGNAGQVLTSDGAGVYWGNMAAGTGSGASVTISDTAPVSPSAGDMWWNSSIGSLYIYYNDGDTSQWVEASPGGAGGSSSSVTSGRSFTHAWFFGG